MPAPAVAGVDENDGLIDEHEEDRGGKRRRPVWGADSVCFGVFQISCASRGSGSLLLGPHVPKPPVDSRQPRALPKGGEQNQGETTGLLGKGRFSSYAEFEPDLTETMMDVARIVDADASAVRHTPQSS